MCNTICTNLPTVMQLPLAWAPNRWAMSRIEDCRTGSAYCRMSAKQPEAPSGQESVALRSCPASSRGEVDGAAASGGAEEQSQIACRAAPRWRRRLIYKEPSEGTENGYWPAVLMGCNEKKSVWVKQFPGPRRGRCPVWPMNGSASDYSNISRTILFLKL
jgi:hypothetical protein